MDGIHLRCDTRPSCIASFVKLSLSGRTPSAFRCGCHSVRIAVGYYRHFINFDHASSGRWGEHGRPWGFSLRQFDPQALSRGAQFWRVLMTALRVRHESFNVSAAFSHCLASLLAFADAA